jgi:AraC-like DNA-binding protein
MTDLLEQMCSRVLRHTDAIRMDTLVPGIGIGVIFQPREQVPVACRSGICLVLQGAKQMIVGDHLLRCQAGNYFASLIELPSTRSTVEMQVGKPYIATSLVLNPQAIAELLAELPPDPSSKTIPAYAVTAASYDVLEAWDRYLALLDRPSDIRILAPSRERELLYRLLQSELGPVLRQIARKEGRTSQIRRAIEWMQHHFEQPALMKELAGIAGMSVPSFNRNFKAVTSTSPLQYQKTLRLQAARRLLAIKSDVADAAFSVGYESTSQFSREYSRLFGISPRQDAMAMQSASPNLSATII